MGSRRREEAGASSGEEGSAAAVAGLGHEQEVGEGRVREKKEKDAGWRKEEKRNKGRERKGERREKRIKGGGGRLFSRKGKTIGGWLQKCRGWQQKTARGFLGFGG